MDPSDYLARDLLIQELMDRLHQERRVWVMLSGRRDYVEVRNATEAGGVLSLHTERRVLIRVLTSQVEGVVVDYEPELGGFDELFQTKD